MLVRSKSDTEMFSNKEELDTIHKNLKHIKNYKINQKEKQSLSRNFTFKRESIKLSTTSNN